VGIYFILFYFILTFKKAAAVQTLSLPADTPGTVSGMTGRTCRQDKSAVHVTALATWQLYSHQSKLFLDQ